MTRGDTEAWIFEDGKMIPAIEDDRIADGIDLGHRRRHSLLTIEALKIETSVRADRDATAGEVVTRHGATVDARDLLVVLG